VLKFRALDENGRPCALTRAPAPATTAPVVQVSDDAADVEDYKLIWNGRGFRLTWAERQSGQVRHMQTALTRYGSRSVHDNPSGPLVRATLINGATNIDATALPNVASPAAPAPASGTGGYGWGRLNMRQSVTPAPPITFHARDDAAVGPGRRILYRFDLPAATSLLRVTLSWNDMPGALLTNRLLLSVQNAGAGLAFYGNQWNAAAPLHASRPFAIIVAPPANEGVHNTQQVVIENPPAGSYVVEVRGVVVQTHNLNQLQAQPFALVFVGSGREVRFQGLAVPPGAGVFY
jgi:hypothetical protein